MRHAHCFNIGLPSGAAAVGVNGMEADGTEEMELDEVDAARAALYRLLAHVLGRSPTPDLLARMAALNGDDTPLGSALRGTAAAAGASPGAWAAEYDVLFIGVARGELLPYASFYLTGFLHERPLARLRADLGPLGLARADDRSDPEDHIAMICEVMATLIERQDEAEAIFFARHLAPWGVAFFTDLERAKAAGLFRSIGQLGRLLVALDRQGFAYAADPIPVQGAA